MTDNSQRVITAARRAGKTTMVREHMTAQALNMVGLTPVQSSMLTAAGYNAELRTLRILYPNGAQWDYADVPPDVYEGLLKAESVGKYVAAKVKPVYKATRVEVSGEPDPVLE